jgi:heterodisulfide reductase subunit B2
MEDNMRFALFLGCTVPTRALNYELSARKVAEKLGIELVDIPEFTCCGFPIRSVSQDAGFLMAARNLALAEKEGLNIVTLCSACNETLQEANYHFAHHPEDLAKTNGKLAKFGLEYKGTVVVKHFSRMLWEDFGTDKLKELVVKPLTGIKAAAHYGCHYLKPSKIYDRFDDPENPRSLDELIEATGAEPLRYFANKDKCCGGAILGVKEITSLSMSNSKLKGAKEQNADALVLICPFCSVMYEGNQKKIEKAFEAEYSLPILYYPQLLGLSLGFAPDDLGFNLNRIKAKSLLAKLEV